MQYSPHFAGGPPPLSRQSFPIPPTVMGLVRRHLTTKDTQRTNGFDNVGHDAFDPIYHVETNLLFIISCADFVEVRLGRRPSFYGFHVFSGSCSLAATTIIPGNRGLVTIGSEWPVVPFRLLIGGLPWG